MSQKIINPANQEVIAEVDLAKAKEVECALASAREAFDAGPWRNLGLSQRKQLLLNISQGILDNAGELARLETLNTGKPIKESTFMDIPSAAKTFEYCANNLEAFLQEDSLAISSNTKARFLREPLGVALLIVPWNYPLLIACWKIASALAAGCTVILKPASLTPLTALALAKIIGQAGLPKGVFNLVVGSGNSVGEALCKDKRIDIISFTGSNLVGKKILEYSSSSVKKMVMELGGKSASIILKDADMEVAVNGSLCSIFLNQGQMCTAMSRIFVQEEVYEEFIREFVAKAKKIRLGDGAEHETQMGPLISASQRDGVAKFVQQAVAAGAKLLCGGKIPEDQRLKKGFFYEPTVLSGVNPQMEIFKQEVFGPVACVSKFSRIEEAIDLANESDFALAAGIWSKDTASAQKLSAQINAGIVWINTYGMFHNEVPYGGFKQSGFGKELGKEGMLEYTRHKSVVEDCSKDEKPLVNYWYSF